MALKCEPTQISQFSLFRSVALFAEAAKQLTAAPIKTINQRPLGAPSNYARGHEESIREV